MWKVGLLVTLMVVAGSVLVLRGVGAPAPVPDIDPTASLPRSATATGPPSGAAGGSDDRPGANGRGSNGAGDVGVWSGSRPGSAKVEASNKGNGRDDSRDDGASSGASSGADDGSDDGADGIHQVRPEPQDIDDDDDGDDDGRDGSDDDDDRGDDD